MILLGHFPVYLFSIPHPFLELGKVFFTKPTGNPKLPLRTSLLFGMQYLKVKKN